MPEIATPRDPRDLIPPNVVEAVVFKPPANTADSLTVIVPSFSEQREYEVRYWQPRGSALPVRGTGALVAFTESGEPWLVAYWDGQEVDYGTGGGGGPDPPSGLVVPEWTVVGSGGGAPGFNAGWSGACRYRVWEHGHFDFQAGYAGGDGGLVFGSSTPDGIVTIPEIADRNPQGGSQSWHSIGRAPTNSAEGSDVYLDEYGTIWLWGYSSGGDYSFSISTVLPDANPVS